MLLYSFVSNNNWVFHFQIPRFLLLRHHWTLRFFPFSDTVGSRGLFLVWKPLDTEFSLFRTPKSSFFRYRGFAFRKLSEAKVSPFSDTVESRGFPFFGHRRKPRFPFFGHHQKPMFFLFWKPQCLLQRTPSDTEFFLFQTKMS